VATRIATETQRHGEEERSHSIRNANKFLLHSVLTFLCVSVSLWQSLVFHQPARVWVWCSANSIPLCSALWRSSCLYIENNGRGRCLRFDMLRGSEWHPGRPDWLRSSRAWRSPRRPFCAFNSTICSRRMRPISRIVVLCPFESFSILKVTFVFSQVPAWAAARWVPLGIPLSHRRFRFARGRFVGVCWKLSLQRRRVDSDGQFAGWGLLT